MPKKILIIRFNSIGDIVLTSPVIRNLAIEGYELHYLCKKAYRSLLEPNPYLSQLWLFEGDYKILIKQLKAERFDYVLDLHNNLRSYRIKSQLSCRTYTLTKSRWRNFLLTRFDWARKQREHIVYRFLDVASPLLTVNVNAMPEFYFPKGKSYGHISLPSKYSVIVVSTAFYTKNIPVNKLIHFLELSSETWILIGGPDDLQRADQIMQGVKQNNCRSLVGKLSLDESAYVMKESSLVLSGDTGMMHIAAALAVPVVAVFGSTHPILGYTPFSQNTESNYAIVENKNIACRPCTRQGRHSCPKKHFRCMNDISVEEIKHQVELLLKS